MSARILLLGSSILLVACSTVQENPNYQYSSKYRQGQAPATQQVAQNTSTYQTSSVPVQSQGDVTPPQMQTLPPYATAQVSIPARHPAHDSTSPTEQAYDTDSMIGTPGYEVMRAQQAETYSAPPATARPSATPPAYTQAPVHAQNQPRPAPYYQTQPSPPAPAPTGPRPITYDYGDNLRVQEPVARPPSGVAVNSLTNQAYTVKQGDTIYSMSRSLCVPMDEITIANGIGTDYAISIGQTLYLPYSRCQP